MFDLGKMQTLKVREINASGAFLLDPEEPGAAILLPGKQIPEGTHTGSELTVFIYRDSEDRLIATTKTPAIKLGEIALLPVVSATDIGAFLDWGLDKDLFLPFKEQRLKVRPGMNVLVALYIDKSNRLSATMNVYEHLSAESPYKLGDHVTGTIYQINDEIGAFVAVDNKYFGLIPKKELYARVRMEDVVDARVINVRADGKLNLSIRKKAYAQMTDDAAKLQRVLEEYGGVLPFNDKASPEIIKREMEMSKAAFKRAVGQLLKAGKIEITEKNIRRIKE